MVMQAASVLVMVLGLVMVQIVLVLRLPGMCSLWGLMMYSLET
jgi:hypothetical protein